MPYLRLYSREVSLAEKRVLAEKLIGITLGAFDLQPEERASITVQFVPRHFASDNLDPLPSAKEPAAVLEISDRSLTVHKIRALVAAATPMLRASAVVPRPGRIARMLGLEADASRQIGFQFNEMSSPGEETERFAPMELPRAA